jgi:hypothetical protein
VIRGFNKNRLGANEHLVAFGGGGSEAVKLRDVVWRVDCGVQFGVLALADQVQAVKQQAMQQAVAPELRARLELEAVAAVGMKMALLQGAGTVRPRVASRVATRMARLYMYL